MAVISNGTTLINNGALDSGVAVGKLTLISTQTASSSASISFTSSIDSTYDSYIFKIINVHPATDGADFTFNMSSDGGSNYNVTKQSTQFNARHAEDDGTAALGYVVNNDLQGGTGFQIIGDGVGGSNDECGCGTLQIYRPSSTTFVKHFICNFQNLRTNDNSYNVFTAGYGNTTSAVNAVQFKFSGGNIDSGVIKMYGVG
tara:strand:+ start:127 stop:729 length:603 start_codon:yes stop_codon:yes gene_type:complete